MKRTANTIHCQQTIETQFLSLQYDEHQGADILFKQTRFKSELSSLTFNLTLHVLRSDRSMND